MKKIISSPYRLYILIRSDLPSMNPGRGMAQAAHAANQFVHEHGKNPCVKAWQKEARGFGTTICLSATKDQIEEVVLSAKMHSTKNYEIKAGVVIDPTYKYSVDMDVARLIPPSSFSDTPLFLDNGLVVLFRNELTCGYVFLSEDDPNRESLVGALPLHP